MRTLFKVISKTFVKAWIIQISALISALFAEKAEAGVGGLQSAQSVLMVKSGRLETSKGAQQTFAHSSPCLPGAEYKL